MITGFTLMHGKGSAAAAGSRQRRDSSHITPAGPGSASTPVLPSGYEWYSLPAAAAGANAGFRLAIPRGWTVSRSGLTTYLRDPAGTAFMEVDLTRQGGRGAMAQARWLQARTRAQGKFPGYRRISLRPVRMLNSIAARWSFTWREAGAGRVFVQDYLFTLTSGRRLAVIRGLRVRAGRVLAADRALPRRGDPHLPAAHLRNRPRLDGDPVHGFAAAAGAAAAAGDHQPLRRG